MRFLALIPILLLAGCFGSVPVKPSFPEVPKELMQVCPDLVKQEPTEKLSDILKVVTNNYSQYHECQLSVDLWIEWYRLQKDIYNK